MEFDSSHYSTFEEGEAEILSKQQFFDETQVTNMDMSIAVLRTFIFFNEYYKLHGARVLEASSISHLRALRYASEIDEIGRVVALHNNTGAYHACRRNSKLNGSVAFSKVEPILVDARVHMLGHSNKYHVVDLDPCGSPSILLDSAIQSVAEGGLLMCTSTDLNVLGGGNVDLCYSRYGCYPVKGKYYREMALRTLLACIEGHANRHKRYICPVLSIQMDSYVRVFVLIRSLACDGLVCNMTPSMEFKPLHNLSYVYQCVGCDSFHLQSITHVVPKYWGVGISPAVKQVCKECGNKFNIGGPIWSGFTYNPTWVSFTLMNVNSTKDRYPTYDRISAVLTAVLEEIRHAPLFFSLHSLCATLKCRVPQAIEFRSAVINAGYKISGTHMDPLGMKSDAPMEVIWDIMRCWVKKHPVEDQRADEPGSIILAKEPVVEVNFARAVAATTSLCKAWYLRSCETNWGPKLRASLQVTSKHFNLLPPDTLNQTLNQAPIMKKHDTDINTHNRDEFP